MRRLTVTENFSVFIFFFLLFEELPCTFRGNSVDYIKFSYFSFIVSQAMKKEKDDLKLRGLVNMMKEEDVMDF